MMMMMMMINIIILTIHILSTHMNKARFHNYVLTIPEPKPRDSTTKPRDSATKTGALPHILSMFWSYDAGFLANISFFSFRKTPRNFSSPAGTRVLQADRGIGVKPGVLAKNIMVTFW